MEGEKTPSPTRVDELDGLIRLLACIKEMGWNRAFEDDVRYGNTKFGSSHLYTDPLHFLCDALAALQDSMFCMKTLNKVRSLLEKKIRTIKRRCDPLALEDGMRRLPDELLARIFEIGHLSTRSCTSLLVSHVSFRFRQVAIRTRLLWTRLSAGYTNDQLQAFVSRSGNLDLEIMCRSPPRERNDFLKVVISLSNRWSSAIISSPPLAKLISAAGSTSFRNLKYIYSDYSFDLREWSMPFLSHCVGRCLVINKQNLSQITSLELCFWKDDLDIPELAETLYQAKNLQDLSFRFMDYKFYSVHQPSLKAVEIPPPHSFSTKALKLLITGGQHSFVGHVMQPLNSVLTYISPLKVDISLENADVQCLYNTTGEIFPHGSTIQLRITRRVVYLQKEWRRTTGQMLHQYVTFDS
ncbi:hypothetical protein BD410DRAFT_868090 [Rickenella mellea]|uniref:F-box domain-containing protein n=1 Tax=Rickenella mellea TaxID=50990 RepID=A0A4Y7Q302_9AGAM|nr:hypothetical protein BD410DRAFT_868090 [Rickenella mellea]